MTAITVDIGNTRIKAGIFEDGNLQSVFRYENMEGLLLYCESLDAGMPMIVSSVTNYPLVSLQQYFNRLIILNHQTPIPLHNRYQTPHTLGNDRLAAVIGAYGLHTGKNCLVIDAGTCIKYDFVSSDGYYDGGSIAPGVDMKFKSLHHYTEKLPLVHKTGRFTEKGNNTEEALSSGVMYGTLAEMQGFIHYFSGMHPELITIVTGGDGPLFAGKLKGTIFAEPDLVLKGLFEILKYNAIVPK